MPRNQAGFRVLESVGGMEAIAAHTRCLAEDLHARLRALRHANGNPVLRFFGRWGSGAIGRSSPRKGVAPSTGASDTGECDAGNAPGRPGQGPVLAMSFVGPGGEPVGHAEVGKLAALEGIQLRTGCFCNPGACQAALGLSDRDMMRNFEK